MIIYPNPIKINDTFGITATSAGITKKIKLKRLELAKKYLNSLGYKTIETSNVRTNSNFVSSDAKTRAKEFMSLWKKENISLIGLACGGEFLMEMLPFIDKKTIKENKPKWITGFSDSSLLNFYLTTNFNIATATTTNILKFGMNPIHESLTKQLEILSSNNESVQESFKLYEGNKIYKNEKATTPYDLNTKVKYKNLYNKQEEIFSGRLIGGCIDVLLHIIGTPFDNTINFCNQFKEEGMLWYLEDCELSLLELYRTLWHMKQVGWFNNANGVIFGRTKIEKKIKDFTYETLLHKIFDDLKIPVIYDVDFGHVAPQWTMINGSLATFEYKNHKGKITQKLI